jgi:plastocyanin
MHAYSPSQRLQIATQVVLAGVFWVVATLMSSEAIAVPLEIQVSDRNGAPVRDVVVTVSDGRPNTMSAQATATRVVMDQLAMRFVPEVLVVPVGTAVNFPNSDTISHQVYSFSRAKPFQLPLYKGASYPPVTFDKPGLVVLGCNIHDSMVGYIYVTDARWYGQTNAAGKMTLPEVASGKVSVTIWGSFIADPATALTRSIELSGNDKQTLEFKLMKPLRSSPEPRPRRADWDY